jgi:hypothetical protein
MPFVLTEVGALGDNIICTSLLEVIESNTFAIRILWSCVAMVDLALSALTKDFMAGPIFAFASLSRMTSCFLLIAF